MTKFEKIRERAAHRKGGAAALKKLLPTVASNKQLLALRGSGLEIAEQPSSQRDLQKVQALFNEWHEETGLPFSHLSRIAACSVGENYLEQA
ncbi:MAG: hypothetical protein WDZ52_08405 [Pseudohongiellaceae bacterium]